MAAPAAAPAADAPTSVLDEEEAVDGEVVGEPGEELAIVEQSQHALASARIIDGATPTEVIEKATQIANAMKHLVDAQGFAVDVGGKKPHLEIGAWQALGVLLGALGGEALHSELVHSSTVGELTTYHVHEVKKKWGGPKGQRVVVETIELDYDVEGRDWEAIVEVKTAAGVVVGRSKGMCARSESSWMKKPDPAVCSMAETRAASRAFRAALGWVVAMAGYNPTPAEEMPTPAPTAAAGPAFGVAPNEKYLQQTRKAIAYALEVGSGEQLDAEEQAAVDGVLALIKQSLTKVGYGDGEPYLPMAAAAGAAAVATAIKRRIESAAADPQPPQAQARPEAERPQPGTVKAPVLPGQSVEGDEAALKAAGCNCPDPVAGRNFADDCPIHGIPF